MPDKGGKGLTERIRINNFLSTDIFNLTSDILRELEEFEKTGQRDKLVAAINTFVIALRKDANDRLTDFSRFSGDAQKIHAEYLRIKKLLGGTHPLVVLRKEVKTAKEKVEKLTALLETKTAELAVVQGAGIDEVEGAKRELLRAFAQTGQLVHALVEARERIGLW